VERGLGFGREALIGRQREKPCVGRAPARGGRRLTGGPPMSVSGGEKASTDSVRLGLGQWAGSGGRPDSVPRPLYSFFVLSLFFSDFYFFYNFCKTTLNKPKQNPKIF
jgi:hypothetical protein